ncbi:NIF-domain-containing protein [Mycena sanguinolenta]|nr:NIF-domain-containing protein [Mycena sanguinolenta]
MFFGRRRHNKSATPQAAASSPHSPSITRPPPSRKSTLLARVISKLIPCVPNLDPAGALDALTEQPKEMHPSAPSPQTAPSNVQSNVPTLPSPLVDEPSPPADFAAQPPQITVTLIENQADGSRPSSVTAPGSTDEVSALTQTAAFSDESEATSFSDDEGDVDPFVYDEDAEEQRLIKNGGSGIPIGPDGRPRPLLPPISPRHLGRKCLVLDLDETLIHSSFKSFAQPDFILPVEIDSQWHRFHVLKRPGVENFLQKMGEIYEVVVWTAALSQYANLVLDRLDTRQSVSHRLFRQSCFLHKGAYVKDLSQLGRPLADTIILDNSPVSFLFHPHNSVPVSSWFNDPHDGELADLIPFLSDLAFVPDVRGILNGGMP